MNDDLVLSAKWELHDASITAVGDRGAVYNEQGLHLTVIDGRNEILYSRAGRGDDEPLRECWEYQMNFYLADCEESESSVHDQGRVAIMGILADGRTCKIVGSGFVGRDNLGQIEGTYFKPPRIEIDVPIEEQMVGSDDEEDEHGFSGRISRLF